MIELSTASPRDRTAHKPLKASFPWICTAILLLSISIDRYVFRGSTADPTAYHLKVKQIADGIPLVVEDWLGVDVPIPQAAVALLKPNIIVSRRYDDMQRQRHVTLLIVQCTDARDILGHYPPICYVSQGWTLANRQPADWMVRDLSIHGTQYVFTTPQRRAVAIDNFLMLPNGQTARDMDDVEVAAKDRRQKYLGVGQIQLIYDAEISEADREQVFRTFIGVLQPLINQILQRDAITTAGNDLP